MKTRIANLIALLLFMAIGTVAFADTMGGGGGGGGSVTPGQIGLTNGNVIVGNASNVGAGVTMTGVVNISNAGATTFGTAGTLPNGTVATTQSSADNSTKVSTDAFSNAAAIGTSSTGNILTNSSGSVAGLPIGAGLNTTGGNLNANALTPGNTNAVMSSPVSIGTGVTPVIPNFLTPTVTTTQTTFSLPSISGAGPGGLCLGNDGNMYMQYVNTSTNVTYVAQITPSGAITEYSVIGAGNGGHGLGAIVAGPNGLLYFYGPVSFAGSFVLYSCTYSGGSVTSVYTGVHVGNNLVVGPDGNIWGIDTSTHKIFVYNINAATGTQYACTTNPGANAVLVVGTDGRLWTTGGSNFIAMTTSGVETEYAAANTLSPALAVGPNGSLYATRSSAGGVNTMYQCTTAGVVTTYANSGVDSWNGGANSIITLPNGYMLATGYSNGDQLTVNPYPSNGYGIKINRLSNRTGGSGYNLLVAPDGSIWLGGNNGPIRVTTTYALSVPTQAANDKSNNAASTAYVDGKAGWLINGASADTAGTITLSASSNALRTADMSGGNITYNLPVASTSTGLTFTIQMFNGGAGTDDTVIVPNGTDKINGASSATFSCNAPQTILLQCFGSGWCTSSSPSTISNGILYGSGLGSISFLGSSAANLQPLLYQNGAPVFGNTVESGQAPTSNVALTAHTPRNNYVSAASGNVTVTITPTANERWTVIRTDGSVNTMTIAAASGSVLGPTGATGITTQYSAREYVSDGTNVYCVSANGL